MSVREREDERENKSSCRGLSLAVAAIGVGVGAAMYYFFNKRAENPDTAGATTSGWTCEEPLSRQRRRSRHHSSSSSSSQSSSTDDCSPSSSSDDHSPTSSPDNYRTVSEHITTDTSMCSESDHDDGRSSPSQRSSTSDTYSITDDEDSPMNEESSPNHSELTINLDSSEPEDIVNVSDTEPDSELDMDWDVTTYSLDVPRPTEGERSPSPLWGLLASFNSFVTSPRNRRRVSEDNRLTAVRDQRFRQRSWSLEECSICCEIMLQEQPLRQLACSHNFHVACVEPWLEEHQTCPNCRKSA